MIFKIRPRSALHDYQKDNVERIKKIRKVGLFLGLGCGKTCTTLSAIVDLYYNLEIEKILIVAPLRVATNTWTDEIQLWEHTKDIKTSKILGEPDDRLLAMKSKAPIHIVNRENVIWLFSQKNHPKYDMIVLDESSSFKNSSGKRFKALRKPCIEANYVVLLTGTPATNGLEDLWSQLFLLDQGNRLGRNITSYRQRYFYQTGFKGYIWKEKPESFDEIMSKISDICFSMRAEDYLTLPDCTYITVDCFINDKLMKQYKKLEKDFILEIEGDSILANSATSISIKLLQFCNGFLYQQEATEVDNNVKPPRKVFDLHDSKIEALKDLIEDNPSENFLIAYHFKEDLVKLQKAFPKAVLLSDATIPLWNAGKIKMFLAHPMSSATGLNLQHGGANVVWYGLNWDLELYQQFNGRLFRQGQKNNVKIIHLVLHKGIDKALVLSRLQSKGAKQDDILNVLKIIKEND